MDTKIRTITLHLPTGKVEVAMDRVVALAMTPYPVVVVREGEGPGVFRRYAGMAVELLEEETTVIVPRNGAERAG